jgi:7,8-dihydroneopterin aldolase/epimerase/oxygenase
VSESSLVTSKPSFGILGIHQLEISCVVGIYPEERQQEQVLLIDIKVKLELSRCLASGRLEDSVDYSLLAKLCSELAQKNKYLLLETFANDILDHCQHHFHPFWGWVRIQKPSAIPNAAYAFVEFERHYRSLKEVD